MCKTRSTTKQKLNEEIAEKEQGVDKSQQQNLNNEILDKKLNPLEKKLEAILTSINFLSC